VNFVLEPINVLPGVGVVRVADVSAATKIGVLAPVRFSDEFSARVAVRIWPDETVDTTRPLNVATPDEKLDDVDPVNATGLPDIDIEMLDAVANVPLSVNCTFVVKRPNSLLQMG
jgi:hypothetical protein